VSPLLTLVVTVPYDTTDPQAALVNLFVLDCDLRPPNGTSRGEGLLAAEKLQDPSLRPSASNYRYRGRVNSRGQIVAFVARSMGPSGGRVNEGRHCYYRVAVVSHRLRPMAFSIRGFDWHPSAALAMEEPLEGMVDRKHSFTYQLEGAREVVPGGPRADVVLNLEVCSGSVILQTAAKSPSQSSALATNHPTSGLLLTRLPLEQARWLQLSSRDGSFSTYILTAEDPAKRQWLEPKPSSDLVLHVEGREAKLSWAPAKLFGSEQPFGGSGGDADPQAEYEVFWVKEGLSLGNASTACGLYLDYRQKRSQRMWTSTVREATISGLDPDSSYVFNVVARSRQTGHSVAYTPSSGVASGPARASWGGPRSRFWDQAVPLLVIAASAAFVAWARPCCKSHGAHWRRFELELPSWGGGGGYNAMRETRGFGGFGGSSSGSYAPPSVVGQAY